MKSVNIALLKAQLSRFLKLVKKGEEILVLDRNQVIAKIVPNNGSFHPEVKVISAVNKLSQFFANFKPVKSKNKTDVLAELLKERGDR